MDTDVANRRLPLAGFLARLAGNVLDLVVVFGFAYSLQRIDVTSARWAVLLLCVQNGIVAAYTPTMHALWGQTIGKMAVGIQVRTVNGERVGWREALLRSSVDIVVCLVLLVGMVSSGLKLTNSGQAEAPSQFFAVWIQSEGPFFAIVRVGAQVWIWSEVVTMLFNEQRRAIHDFIGGTIVVRSARWAREQPNAG